MIKTESKTASAAVKDILLWNPDRLNEVIRAVMQEVLEAEMDDALDASKSERTPERLGYHSRYYGRRTSCATYCRSIIPSSKAFTTATVLLVASNFRITFFKWKSIVFRDLPKIVPISHDDFPFDTQ